MNGTNESSTKKSEREGNMTSIKIPTTTEDGIPIRKLYVSNLPRKVTKKDLNEIFAKYGKVQCNCPIKKYTGVFTFITYTDVNDALNARIAAGKKELIYRGKVLKVNPATSDKQPDSAVYQQRMRATRKRNTKKQKNTQKIKVDESSNPTLNILDDDCLIKIFLYLSISDRLRIERVCKRWQVVNLQSWTDIRDLKLDASSFVLAPYTKPHRMTDRAVEKILICCGRFLNTLEINSFELDCTPDVISYIAQHCHNLTGLTLYMDKYPIKYLSRFFVNARKLSNLKLFALGKEFSGDCLRHLPMSVITQISLHAKSEDDTFATSFRYFSSSAAKGIGMMKKLWKFELNGFSLKPTTLKAIASNNVITHLTFSNCSLKRGGNPIVNLVGIKYLDVAKVIEINDSFLQKLAANCPELQYLNISHCVSVTNAGINAIAKLDGLETLKIDDLFDVSSTVFSQFKSLKVLHCQNCHFVSDDGLEELIMNAPHLEELNLCGTTISADVLDTAYNVTLDRVNPIPLRVIVNSSLEVEWIRPLNISPSVLIIETRDENLWDPYWDGDMSGDEYDDCGDIDGDESDYDSVDCWEFAFDDINDINFIDLDRY